MLMASVCAHLQFLRFLFYSTSLLIDQLPFWRRIAILMLSASVPSTLLFFPGIEKKTVSKLTETFVENNEYLTKILISFALLVVTANLDVDGVGSCALSAFRWNGEKETVRYGCAMNLWKMVIHLLRFESAAVFGHPAMVSVGISNLLSHKHAIYARVSVFYDNMRYVYPHPHH